MGGASPEPQREAKCDEQREIFHQDLRVFEERYQGKSDETMMADYCWSVKREIPGAFFLMNDMFTLVM